jgi:hypothetical protein
MAASGLLHILHGWEVASSFALALALVMIGSVCTKTDLAREGILHLQQHQLAEFLEPFLHFPHRKELQARYHQESPSLPNAMEAYVFLSMSGCPKDPCFLPYLIF